MGGTVVGRPGPRVCAIAVAILASVAVVGCDSQVAPSSAASTSPTSPPSTTSPTGAATPSATGAPTGPLGLSNVAVEEAAGATATIPRSGGKLTATGSNGTTYTLQIPSGALAADTEISMYPVASIANLPAGASISGAVHLLPEGLQLAAPGTLTIELPAGSDLTGVAGFGYAGDGQDAHLTAISLDGTTVTIVVPHFSGFGAGTTLGDIVGDDVERGAIEQAFYDAVGTSRMTGALEDWYHTRVEPKVTACQFIDSFAPGEPCDFATYSMAEYFIDYYQWLQAVAFGTGTDTEHTGVAKNLEPLLLAARNAAAKQLVAYSDALNFKCNTVAGGPANGDDPASPLYWAAAGIFVNTWAKDLGLAPAIPLLKLESILDRLCVQVVIEPSRSYSGTKPGDEGTLHVPVGVKIQDKDGKAGPLRHDIPLQVKADWKAASSVGNPDGQGHYDVTLTWPNGVDPFKI